MDKNFIAISPVTAEEAKEVAAISIHVALNHHGEFLPDITLGEMGLQSDCGVRRLVCEIERIGSSHGRSFDTEELIANIYPRTKLLDLWDLIAKNEV